MDVALVQPCALGELVTRRGSERRRFEESRTVGNVGQLSKDPNTKQLEGAAAGG